jgi:hypothetical protein
MYVIIRQYIYEVAERNLHNNSVFEGNMTMSADISLRELLTKLIPIIFITK